MFSFFVSFLNVSFINRFIIIFPNLPPKQMWSKREAAFFFNFVQEPFCESRLSTTRRVNYHHYHTGSDIFTVWIKHRSTRDLSIVRFNRRSPVANRKQNNNKKTKQLKRKREGREFAWAGGRAPPSPSVASSLSSCWRIKKKLQQTAQHRSQFFTF